MSISFDFIGISNRMQSGETQMHQGIHAPYAEGAFP